MYKLQLYFLNKLFCFTVFYDFNQQCKKFLKTYRLFTCKLNIQNCSCTSYSFNLTIK